MNNKWGQQNMAIVDKMAIGRGSTVLLLSTEYLSIFYVKYVKLCKCQNYTDTVEP